MGLWGPQVGASTSGTRGVAALGPAPSNEVPGARLTAGLFVRWLGFIFFWAFLALWFQMEGLVGPNGILPVGDFLQAVRQAYPGLRGFLLAPSLLWLGTGAAAIHGLCALGLLASVALMLRFYPRWAAAVCLICFVSFLSTAQAFASYQSDGMLMSAGLIALFLDARRPSWWSWFSLRWLWFTIYFGSGIAKWMSHDPEWRHLTALDHYYENGPLPTWIAWYAQQHLPHIVEAAIALSILATELGLAWLCFGPRRARIACFWLTTPFQIAIILTANYGFLNYLVLGLGLALIDDRHLRWLLGLIPWRQLRRAAPVPAMALATGPPLPPGEPTPSAPPEPPQPSPPPSPRGWLRSGGSVILLAWFLITALNLGHRVWTGVPRPRAVDAAMDPFRIADPFGLFAVMTTARYELEFQGSNDGLTWTPYPFRYKPQDPTRAPGIYAPYQPRFDWNLWFASLDSYPNNPWVQETEVRLLQGDPTVLALFAGNPFPRQPPQDVRVVVYQYWFSTPAEKRQQGVWWTRKLLGLYAPALERRGGAFGFGGFG